MVTVDFDFMGEATRLALAAERYEDGGLAIILLDATDPASEGYLGEWGVLNVSVPGAEEWCREPGHVVIDAGNMPTALVDALAAAGIVEPACRTAASGMGRYPLAVVAGDVLSRMGNRAEVLEEALGSTVVVEYESAGEGGAFEAGTAPAGSAELDALVVAARAEADAAVRAGGGWAAVRVGFGDAETVDCDTGRTVYIAEGGDRKVSVTRSGRAAFFIRPRRGPSTAQAR